MRLKLINFNLRLSNERIAYIETGFKKSIFHH
jgi:hypothetical protein